MNTKEGISVSATVPKKHPVVFICAPVQNEAPDLVEYLKNKHFSVRCIHDSSSAIDGIITHVPDIVLLDAYLPVAGGYEVCSAVRPYYSGHIIVQGHDVDEAAQMLAFERGADDYVALPVSPALLTARINARLRRSNGFAGQTSALQIRTGNLVLDAARREIILSGEPIGLTTIQFELFWYLAKRSGRVVSREEIYEALYNEKYNGFDRSVDVHISRIRHQLGDTADNPVYLKTIRGVGYLFVGDENHG